MEEASVEGNKLFNSNYPEYEREQAAIHKKKTCLDRGGQEKLLCDTISKIIIRSVLGEGKMGNPG